MHGIEERASFDGTEYQLAKVVEHVSGGNQVVLCKDGTGELRYVSIEEWRSGSRQAVALEGRTASEVTQTAPVNRYSSEDEKVSLIMSLFRGRTDVYGEGFRCGMSHGS